MEINNNKFVYEKLNQKLVNFEIFINQVGAIYKLLCHIISCGFL